MRDMQRKDIHGQNEEKDDPSWNSNHALSAIWTDVLSHTRLEGHLNFSLAADCIITDANIGMSSLCGN
jgi:hypothetical protein